MFVVCSLIQAGWFEFERNSSALTMPKWSKADVSTLHKCHLALQVVISSSQLLEQGKE